MGGRASKRRKEKEAQEAAERQRQAQASKAASNPAVKNGGGQDRISENDKAILDIKARMRKLKTYEKKLEEQDKTATEKIKELIKAGQKQRAIIHLKSKKFIEAEVTKCNGA